MTESVFSDHEKSFGDKEQKNCVRLTIIDIDVLIKFDYYYYYYYIIIIVLVKQSMKV